MMNDALNIGRRYVKNIRFLRLNKKCIDAIEAMEF